MFLATECYGARFLEDSTAVPMLPKKSYSDAVEGKITERVEPTTDLPQEEESSLTDMLEERTDSIEEKKEDKLDWLRARRLEMASLNGDLKKLLDRLQQLGI